MSKVAAISAIAAKGIILKLNNVNILNAKGNRVMFFSFNQKYFIKYT